MDRTRGSLKAMSGIVSDSNGKDWMVTEVGDQNELTPSDATIAITVLYRREMREDTHHELHHHFPHLLDNSPDLTSIDSDYFHEGIINTVSSFEIQV